MIRNPTEIQVEANGGLPVNVQDQTTRAFDLQMNRILNSFTLASDGVVDSYTLTLTTGHGVIAGDCLGFLEQDGFPQIFNPEVISVAGDVITLDRPVPYPFEEDETNQK